MPQNVQKNEQMILQISVHVVALVEVAERVVNLKFLKQAKERNQE